MRLKLDAACLLFQRVPLVVDKMFPVGRASSPTSVCNHWLQWITLNSVPYPVKDAFSCCYWSLSCLLLKLFCVNTVGSSSAMCECAQERNTWTLPVSVLLYPEYSSFHCKWRHERNLNDSCECLCSSAGVMGVSTLLTVQVSTVWKFFDLCRVHPWNSFSCQGECDEFLTVLLCNFTDPDSRRGVALLAVLLSFWCLFNC